MMRRIEWVFRNHHHVMVKVAMELILHYYNRRCLNIHLSACFERFNKISVVDPILIYCTV